MFWLKLFWNVYDGPKHQNWPLVPQNATLTLLFNVIKTYEFKFIVCFHLSDGRSKTFFHSKIHYLRLLLKQNQRYKHKIMSLNVSFVSPFWWSKRSIFPQPTTCWWASSRIENWWAARVHEFDLEFSLKPEIDLKKKTF